MDKRWVESKKFLALCIVLGVVLILGLVGIIFHAQMGEIIAAIVAYASTHQVSQGAQDFIAKYKGTAVQKAEQFLGGTSEPVTAPTVTEEVLKSLDEEDRYANR